MNTIKNCPTEIINLIKIFYVNYCIGIALVFIHWNDFYKFNNSHFSLLVNQIFSAIITTWLFYNIYKGINWARISWPILMIFGIYFLAGSFLNSPSVPIILKIHGILSILINFLFIYSIFISDSKFWFLKNFNVIGGHSNNTPEHKPQSSTNIDEKDWADALDEFDSPNRKPGVYALCFSRANGNENFAKAEYLAIRSKEIHHQRIFKITKPSTTTTNPPINTLQKNHNESRKSKIIITNKFKADLILIICILTALIMPASFFAVTFL
jgi:hypothetical protein